MREIIVIAHNIRSAHNIGSIFRTCEGFGVTELVLSGYSPYPKLPDDSRLPHLAEKITRHIHKTALGAETMVRYTYQIKPPLRELRDAGFTLAALEQATDSVALSDFTPPEKLVLLLGEEVHGIESSYISQCDIILEIPMMGKKESFNVSVATGIALYGLSVDT